MADSNTMPILSVLTTVKSKLSDLAMKDGQLIFVRDKQEIALDYDGNRKIYKQIEELATESDRTSILAPVTGRYYFVVETSVLWTYQDGWVQITTPPKDVSAAEKAAKDYADILSKRVTGSVDEDGNYIIMFDEQFWVVE